MSISTDRRSEGTTLLDALRARAQAQPDTRVFTFLADGEADERTLTFGALDRRARAVATALQRRVPAGARAVLLHPPGLDYIVAFCGCIYAGVIPVPLYPPRSRHASHAERVQRVVADARAAVLLCSSALRDQIAADLGATAAAAGPGLLAVEALEQEAEKAQQAETADSWLRPAVAPEDVAFLQYTSGTTTMPKGVMVTHGNILANARSIARCFALDASSVTVIWLPPYHDMGLIGGIIQPICTGFHAVLMSPAHFLQRPRRWLEAITRYRATASGGPNFAYDLCARRIVPRERRDLDLSSWRVAFNGAEPLWAGTLQRFSGAFAEAGFRADAFSPCYGLAEATLLATGSPADDAPIVRTFQRTAVAGREFERYDRCDGVDESGVGAINATNAQAAVAAGAETGAPRSAQADANAEAVKRAQADGATEESQAAGRHDEPSGGNAGERPAAMRSQALVSSGAAAPGVEIVVVDPVSRALCASGEAGEIWIRGASVAKGYWGRRDESAQLFGATLADGRGPFLRTGDLGFLQDTELFVTGRLKDLIIVRGRNLYPQDLELAVEQSTPLLRAGGGAVFAIERDGRTDVVIVHEVERRYRPVDLELVAGLVRRALVAQHDVAPHTIVLLRPGGLPKTSSGKVQRHLCRQQFLDGRLDEVGRTGLDERAAHGDDVAEAERLDWSGDDLETIVRAHILGEAARSAGIDPVQVDAAAPFATLGCDSLASTELLDRVERAIGLSLDLPAIPSELSVDTLTARVVERLQASRPSVVPTEAGGSVGAAAEIEASPAASASASASAPTSAAASAAAPAAADTAATTAISALARQAPREGEAFPLTYGQRALWFLEQLATASAPYHIVAAMRTTGALDTAAFGRALQSLARRHPMLRAVFEIGESGPQQRVRPSVPLDYEIADASGLDDEALRERMQGLADRPFDLREGPLFRVHLLEREADERVLLLVFHHLVCDFWSLAVIARDLGALYAAEADGRPPVLPELPVEFSDFVAAQQAHLDDAPGARLWDYWKRELAGPLPVLDLPTDHPRPVTQTHRGGAEALSIDAALTTALKEAARRAGVTPYTLLLAAFHLLLGRHAASTDVSVGSPVAGRAAAAFADVVGYFVNPVVMRAHLDADASTARFIAGVQARVSGALAHQAMPFALLTERLEPIRDPSRTPVFQAMFAYQQTPALAGADLALFSLGVPGARLTLGGVTAESMAFVHRAAQFDLTLAIAESAGVLHASLQYNADLFEAPTIRQMLSHFRHLLAAMIQAPERPLGLVPMLGPEEQQRLLRDYNDTAGAAPLETSDGCIHALIARQAARTPNATALIAEDATLTCAELDRRANRLARRLRRAGAGPDVPVGLCVGRSSALLVGLLGILKAGAAYVPLDPAYPPARLEFMLSDSAAPVLVCERRCAAAIAAAARAAGCVVMALDDEAERQAIALESDREPDPLAVPANLAYVIYTSGSTGTPKAVMVEHRSVANIFAGMDRSVGCGPSDTLLAVTSMSFDISVLELLWTLARGARVVLLSEEAAQPGRRPPHRAPAGAAPKPIDFSLFYFASDSPGTTAERYRLVIEGAKIADRHRFSAVWTPERHFHEFGGLYPNPAVLGAALSTVTERIQIRAGSVVLPLHDPIRVVEEWAVVDNLSKGRVGLAFASGWHADDFAFFPDRYKDRKAITYRHMDQVRRMWAGEPVTIRSGSGSEVVVHTRPRPVQATLPVWITAAGGPETFIEAGKRGAGVLTHLLGQTTADVAEKIRAYREARAAHGHDPAAGHVTLMLHTFVGRDRDAVRAIVREPFVRYLRSSVSLIDNLIKSLNLPVSISAMHPHDLDDLLQFAFERYFETSALFGSPDDCLEIAERVRQIGVDDIACLVDFGVPTDMTLRHLDDLAGVAARAASQRDVAATDDDRSLAALARRLRPTLLQCTPSFLRLFGDAETLAALGSLRTLMLGGEPLPAALAEEVRARLDCRIVNLYGPTETTVWSSSHEITDTRAGVPIGRPLINTSLYVLDAAGQPVPEQLAGELYIGGDGVTRGYLRRPGLTASRFVPDPFGARPGARLYRTGDLARHRRDGTIELLGRTDSQVKLRGFRIELQEVEAVLAAHAAVARAVAVVQDARETSARLVAYVVPRADAALDLLSLRDHAAERLPAYMVPSLLVPAADLPLTSNGKVDRKRLEQASAASPAIESGPAEPRGQLEGSIAEIWQRVLQVDRVGLDDNFFDRGGHSLLVVSVQQQLARLLGREIPLIKLLQHPTVGSLARYLRQEYVDTLLTDSRDRAQRQRRSRRRARAV